MTYFRTKQHRKLMSRVKEGCKRPDMAGENHPMYRGTKFCLDCNKPLSRWSRVRCKSCAAKGYLNSQWQGGKSYEIYPLGWNNTFKEQIRRRDEYKCQVCGKPEIECCRKLDVHHIDYNKENIVPENLVSLCISCHMKTNYRRSYWYGYLTN